MRSALINPIIEKHLIDTLPPILLTQRSREPFATVCRFYLHAIIKSPRILGVIIMSKSIRKANLL